MEAFLLLVEVETFQCFSGYSLLKNVSRSIILLENNVHVLKP